VSQLLSNDSHSQYFVSVETGCMDNHDNWAAHVIVA